MGTDLSPYLSKYKDRKKGKRRQGAKSSDLDQVVFGEQFVCFCFQFFCQQALFQSELLSREVNSNNSLDPADDTNPNTRLSEAIFIEVILKK